MTRILILCGILGTAFSLALVENYAIWNYWQVRRSLIEELRALDGLLGLSIYDTPSPGAPRLLEIADRPKAIRIANGPCEPLTNECREGRLLTAIGRGVQVNSSTPQVNQVLPPNAWE